MGWFFAISSGSCRREQSLYPEAVLSFDPWLRVKKRWGLFKVLSCSVNGALLFGFSNGCVTVGLWWAGKAVDLRSGKGGLLGLPLYPPTSHRR